MDAETPENARATHAKAIAERNEFDEYIASLEAAIEKSRRASFVAQDEIEQAEKATEEAKRASVRALVSDKQQPLSALIVARDKLQAAKDNLETARESHAMLETALAEAVKRRGFYSDISSVFPAIGKVLAEVVPKLMTEAHDVIIEAEKKKAVLVWLIQNNVTLPDREDQDRLKLHAYNAPLLTLVEKEEVIKPWKAAFEALKNNAEAELPVQG
jgi:hypothetical protein